MADLTTVKIRDLIETTQVMTTDYMVLEKDTGTFKCQARYLKGATGLTPNITIGSTLTLPPGQQANVTLSGNTENPIFSFGIPQGVQGQTGPQGPEGPTPDITPLKNDINNRFNALTSQQQGDSEVIEARGGYPALKARLDAINDDLIKYNYQTIVTHTTENNFSSINATKNGYLDNILLEGKTLVVDSNNNVVLPGTQGAMIKSVGDDVTEIKLNSINENLFDGKLELGSINGSIDISSNNQIRNIGYINVYGNLNCFMAGVPNLTILFYDKNKKYISEIGTKGNFNTPNNCRYIRFRTYSTDNITNINSKIIISISDIQNEYKEQIKNTKKVLYKDTDGTWKKPTLRQWDSIEKHSDGKYYYHKRTGVYNALSTNNYIKWNPSQTNETSKFAVSGLNNIYQKGVDFIVDYMICDKINVPNITPNNFSKSDIEGVSTWDNNIQIAFGINKNKLQTDDVVGFKKYLENNPIQVDYKLKNEEIYECTPIDLISYDTQTNYSIECGPIYPKTTLKVNSYLGNVVSILKDKVSYLENVLVDGLKLVVAGNMQELAYRLYPQDFVGNVDDTVDMEVIK